MNAKAERLCFSKPDKSDQSNLVCGYFKIGNLFQIMKRLAEQACPNPPSPKVEVCAQSIFGIGIDVPSWADTSASFTDPDGIKQSVWVPAHNPNSEDELERERAARDRKAFLDLYKVYQMSLVDTSKLVTAAPAITISK